MALTLASSGASAFNTDTTPKTATVSWAAGDIIVVKAASESGDIVINTPTATGLTFTSVANEGSTASTEGSAVIFAATAAASGSAVTVTVTRPTAPTGHFGFHWSVWSGASGTTGGTGNLNESTTNLSPAAGDAVVFILADWNATSPFTRTPATGTGTATEEVETTTGQYAVYAARWEGVTAGSAAYGLSSYTSLKAASAFLIITSAGGGPTNAPATVGAVSTTGQAATGQVRPAASSSAVATTGQPATTQVRPPAGAGAVAVAGQQPVVTVRANAGVASVGASASSAAVTIRANATVAPVAVAGQQPTVSTSSTTSATPTVAPVTLAADQPLATVLAQAGVASVGVAAADASAQVSTAATSAPVAVAGQAATTDATPAGPVVLNTFAPSPADPHSLTITGATAGRDIWLIVNCPAIITTPSSWELVGSRVDSMATYIYRLPAGSNPGGSIGVSLDLTVARAVAAVAIETVASDAGGAYVSLVAPPNSTGSTVWGTNVHTFTARDTVLAIYAYHDSTGTPPTFAASAYDNGFTALADTGWAPGGGNEGVRILVGSAADIGFTADGVALTLTAAGPSGSAVGFLAFDAAPAGTTFAGGGPVGVAAGQAAATIAPRAEPAPVAAAATAPLATVAPQPGAAAIGLAGGVAAATVRAQAAVAAVAVAGQSATTNTSSSTNANATPAPVAITGQPATVQVRALAAAASIGVAAPFVPGSVTVLQLVMDNPVGIGVTASTPVPTVLAQAGAAAVAVAGRQPSVITNNQVLAQAQVAAVGVTATSAAVTVRSPAGTSSVITSAAGPLAQLAARPNGAAVIIAALALLAQARAQAAGAPVAVASRNPVMPGGGATWRVQRGATLNTYRALLDGVHPTTATIT